MINSLRGGAAGYGAQSAHVQALGLQHGACRPARLIVTAARPDASATAQLGKRTGCRQGHAVDHLHQTSGHHLGRQRRHGLDLEDARGADGAHSDGAWRTRGDAHRVREQAFRAVKEVRTPQLMLLMQPAPT